MTDNNLIEEIEGYVDNASDELLQYTPFGIELLERAAITLQKSEWISVEDRLPDDNQLEMMFDVTIKHKGIALVVTSEDRWCGNDWDKFNLNNKNSEITAWIPKKSPYNPTPSEDSK